MIAMLSSVRDCDAAMKSVTLALAILCGFFVNEYVHLTCSEKTNITQFFNHVPNKTGHVAKTVSSFNETTLANFTYTLPTRVRQFELNNSFSLYASAKVDCFGLGVTVASLLERFFRSEPNGSRALDVQFFLYSRKQPQRVYVVLGEQFGLEWTDFKIERRTVIIVHGFLSHGNMEWIKNMEKALLEWDDVNVIVVDWSAGGNTWNYYKAAVNTKIVGYQISQLIEHITNVTINTDGPDTSNWGPLHLIGHSLGAHICGFAAKELKKRQNKWTVWRITGLDPAQPCFRNNDPSVLLYKNDAPLVDVIHTNGGLLTSLGLGMPEALGHMDFYPNGGKMQPGCKNESWYFYYLPISATAIHQAICSHGRSYDYFTESLPAATRNCSFWAQRWNLTYRNFLQKIMEPCNKDTCTEMGIRAEMYKEHGTFFVATAKNSPFCVNITADVIEELKKQLGQDFQGETED